MIYDGGRRSDAARFAGVGLQIIRDWVLRFNAEGPEGLKDRKAPGPPYKLSEEQRLALAAVVESGPDPAIHGVVRWRRCDLAAWLRDRFGVSLAVTTVGQELRRMGYAKLSARPRFEVLPGVTGRRRWPDTRPYLCVSAVCDDQCCALAQLLHSPV